MNVVATDIPKHKKTTCNSYNTRANNNLLKPYIGTNTYKPLIFWRKSASQEHINRLMYINIWLTTLKQRYVTVSDNAILPFIDEKASHSQ
jgi:hypothetical protein